MRVSGLKKMRVIIKRIAVGVAQQDTVFHKKTFLSSDGMPSLPDKMRRAGGVFKGERQKNPQFLNYINKTILII
jgi:hypothetical protein